MLVASLVVLGLALSLGLRLGAQLFPTPDLAAGLSRTGCVHGVLGASALALLCLALRGGPSARAVRLGAGGFGRVGLLMLAAALGAGAIMFGLRVARRKLPMGVVAAHAILAIAGASLLIAYAGLQD